MQKPPASPTWSQGPLRALLGLAVAMGLLTLFKHFGGVHALLIAIGWVSLACLWILCYEVFKETYVNKCKRLPGEKTSAAVASVSLGFLLTGIGMFPCPWLSFYALAALLVMASLLTRRAAGSDFWGRPTHYQWEVRFGLVDLLVTVVVLGSLMGWHFFVFK